MLTKNKSTHPSSSGEMTEFCRWDDKPIVFWNERWSHTKLQDQKECENPVPFVREKCLIEAK